MKILRNGGHLSELRYSLFILRYSLFTLMLHRHPRFIFLSGCMIWPGAGRKCEGKNHRAREVVAALRSPLSLRFSPSRSLFPYPLLSFRRTACLCLYGCFQPCVSFGLRAVSVGISRGRYSLFTEIRIAGLLAAGFSIGRSNLTEAAISGVYREKRERFAHRPRRESPAGAARPEGIASGGSPPGGKCQRGLPARRKTAVGPADSKGGQLYSQSELLGIVSAAIL